MKPMKPRDPTRQLTNLASFEGITGPGFLVIVFDTMVRDDSYGGTSNDPVTNLFFFDDTSVHKAGMTAFLEHEHASGRETAVYRVDRRAAVTHRIEVTFPDWEA